jgi:hypothetical protein
VEYYLTYKIDPIDIPKDLGNTKGILENPWLKIELTKTNAFKVTTVREYLDVKRKGRQPNAVKNKKKIKKSKKLKGIELDEDDEEDEETEESNEDDDEEEEQVGQKRTAKRRKREEDKKCLVQHLNKRII